MQAPTATAINQVNNGKVDGIVRLAPLLHPAIDNLLSSQAGELHRLVTQFGSPLNIVWPEILDQNLQSFRAVLDEQAVDYQIFYAAKVNKSQSLVHAAAKAGLGVDCSSLYEFRDALQAGTAPEKICGTGPAKPDDYLQALIQKGALISIDSLEELETLERLVASEETQSKTAVTLRYRPGSARSSRFGMAPDDIRIALNLVAHRKEVFDFKGFHFHLGGYSHETRASAVAELTRWVAAARALGLAPAMIDIGGGLPIRYVDKDIYAAHLNAQSADHYRNGRVPSSFYPYGGDLDAPTWLSRFLHAPCDAGRTVVEFFRQEGLTLALEPGRSLVDQAAISVFRVTRTKALEDNKHVVFVEGSSFSACETWFSSEFLIDPILVPQAPPQANDNMSFQAYIAGHSCLDEDVITNRLIDFPAPPRAGDLLVYANTAGYQMDLLENEFHRVPMPRRIAVTNDLASVVVDDHSGEVQ